MRFSKLSQALAILVTAVCSLSPLLHPPSNATSLPEEPALRVSDDDEVERQLSEIAREYQEWGPVDAMASWAPLLCRTPLPSDKHHVEFRFSASDDNDTHGQKIYLLYARDRESYQQTGAQPAKVGQVIVKQAWKPAESTDADQTPEGRAAILKELIPQGFPPKHTVKVDGQEQEFPVSPFLHRRGVTYHADQMDSLFIMYKTDANDETTDNGWVYGTVSADGTEVTSSGRVESCMACHVEAGEDRLFGLPSLFQPRR